MSEKEYRLTPFNEPIVTKRFAGHGGFDADKYLRVLKRSKKVIRRIPLYELEQYTTPQEREKYPSPHTKILAAKTTFLEFGSYSGMGVPSFEIVRGLPYSDDSKFLPYLFVVDQIDGTNLYQRKFRRQERIEASGVLDNFLVSFSDYAKNKFHQGGLFPQDQLYGQYVYGKETNKLTNKVYFVDLGLDFDTFDQNNKDAESNQRFITNIVGFIGGFIYVMEDRLGGMYLQKARDNYNDLLNVVANNSSVYRSQANEFRKQFLHDR